MTSMKPAITAILLFSTIVRVSAEETLPPLVNGKAPRTFTRMWAGFDPRAEPLETEVLKKWQEDGVALRIVRFRVGIFKGRVARLAAIYGFPTRVRDSRSKVPGLVQIHGGGQYADHRACLTNAKRGYATVSLAWAGRISAPGYRVSPPEVKLFWDGKTNNPNYRVTTDWGAVDGYHAPGRNPGNVFPSAKPAAWTLDKVESPRNSGWFLNALAARRALTFLEHQPEVDPDRLGVYGHSMGGKLTVMASVDSRVKAAAPSCGGISDRDSSSPLYRATLGDDVSLRKISCPIMFLSPSNDFHGRIGDLPESTREIKSEDWRVTCSPHHNHQDTAEYEVATQLWMDQHLKRVFAFPRTPETKLSLRTEDGVPLFTIRPDASLPVLSVDVYYTLQGKADERPEDRETTMHRFWHLAAATDANGVWTAKLPLVRTDRPLWVYANVRYPLEKPITGAGYYYGTFTANSFNLSSLLEVASAEELKAAGVRATLKPSHLIEDFAGDWKKEWFIYSNDPRAWHRRTHKVHDDRYRAPASARLSIEVRSGKPNTLVVGLNETVAKVDLKGGNAWQHVILDADDFKDVEGNPLTGWNQPKVLRLGDVERLRRTRGERPVIVGKPWKGSPPEFRNLRWIDGPGG